jgi:hypothetical protein
MRRPVGDHFSAMIRTAFRREVYDPPPTLTGARLSLKEAPMFVRKSILALVTVILVVVTIGLLAQSRRDPTAPTGVPLVISGNDVGVRVSGPSDKTGKVAGTLVVKINGQWVDVTSSMTGVPMMIK